MPWHILGTERSKGEALSFTGGKKAWKTMSLKSNFRVISHESLKNEFFQVYFSEILKHYLYFEWHWDLIQL